MLFANNSLISEIHQNREMVQQSSAQHALTKTAQTNTGMAGRQTQLRHIGLAGKCHRDIVGRRFHMLEHGIIILDIAGRTRCQDFRRNPGLIHIGMGSPGIEQEGTLLAVYSHFHQHVAVKQTVFYLSALEGNGICIHVEFLAGEIHQNVLVAETGITTDFIDAMANVS